MKLLAESYCEQEKRWPDQGRHILAQFDEHSIIVYQAYRPEIASYALKHGRFGDAFSYARMSWIKPNFLWMMYRSGWATKAGQEVVLALRLRRSFFEEILSVAVASSFEQSSFDDHNDWKAAVASSDVRLQWDPDHDPQGRPLPRRAVQLGLRGSMLKAYGQRELLEVIDMSEFIAEQREALAAEGAAQLRTPKERVFVPASRQAAVQLGLD
jgi:hypothetical protein